MKLLEASIKNKQSNNDKPKCEVDKQTTEFMTINDISLSVQYIVFPPILPDTLIITFYPVGIFRDTLSLIFSNRREFLAHVPKLIQVSEENLEFATEFTTKSQ